MSEDAEALRMVPPEHYWKPPEFEKRLPELLEKTRAEAQLFKVWKGDIPRCEIETKGVVRYRQMSVHAWHPPQPVWHFHLDHRIGTDLWPVLSAIVNVLGPPLILTPYGTPPRYFLLSGDPDRPLLEITACWSAAEAPPA